MRLPDAANPPHRGIAENRGVASGAGAPTFHPPIGPIATAMTVLQVVGLVERMGAKLYRQIGNGHYLAARPEKNFRRLPHPVIVQRRNLVLRCACRHRFYTPYP